MAVLPAAPTLPQVSTRHRHTQADCVISYSGCALSVALSTIVVLKITTERSLSRKIMQNESCLCLFLQFKGWPDIRQAPASCSWQITAQSNTGELLLIGLKQQSGSHEELLWQLARHAAWVPPIAACYAWHIPALRSNMQCHRPGRQFSESHPAC